MMTQTFYFPLQSRTFMAKELHHMNKKEKVVPRSSSFFSKVQCCFGIHHVCCVVEFQNATTFNISNYGYKAYKLFLFSFRIAKIDFFLSWDLFYGEDKTFLISLYYCLLVYLYNHDFLQILSIWFCFFSSLLHQHPILAAD